MVSREIHVSRRFIYWGYTPADIFWAPFCNFELYFMVARLSECIKQFQNRGASTCSQIKRVEAFQILFFILLLKCRNITTCNVYNVSVVTNWCSIMAIFIVITHDVQVRWLAQSHFHYITEQVAWHWSWIFTNQTRRMGSACIKFSQNNSWEILICFTAILKDLLSMSFGLTVWK